MQILALKFVYGIWICVEFVVSTLKTDIWTLIYQYFFYFPFINYLKNFDSTCYTATINFLKKLLNLNPMICGWQFHLLIRRCRRWRSRKRNDKEPTQGYALLSCQLTSKCIHKCKQYKLQINNIETPFKHSLDFVDVCCLSKVKQNSFFSIKFPLSWWNKNGGKTLF